MLSVSSLSHFKILSSLDICHNQSTSSYKRYLNFKIVGINCYHFFKIIWKNYLLLKLYDFLNAGRIPMTVVYVTHGWFIQYQCGGIPQLLTVITMRGSDENTLIAHEKPPGTFVIIRKPSLVLKILLIEINFYILDTQWIFWKV